ncbi:MAG TPA: phospholipid carrier-dependent glycosyltransferase [Candidatus Eisenbacteria bacterium]|nr:phospholipid carrier-dependent glycosyltransferase [Candidatus Eisenbacteria bacterium]
MVGPDVGAADPGRGAPSRTGAGGAAGGLLVVLVLGLAFRLIIAYALPGSGFGADIAAFRFWAQDLAAHGLYGFYDRPFFHDYTPGYLYVLWVVGQVGRFAGGIGDLIKVPPILADIGLGWLVWSMVRELGGGTRAALLGAALVVANPVSWFDSVVWGQVDSVGVLVLLLAVRELWRDHPERSAVLAVLAALIKPQLGILIPIVAVVTIRRALRPRGAYGDDPPPDGSGMFGWERRLRGPVRIATTALAGLATAFALSVPFGLSLPGLILRIFATAAGYPYLSVNAYNPWALVSQVQSNGSVVGVAVNRLWVCDTTATPGGPLIVRLFDWVIWRSPASTVSCPDGYMIGPLPAVLFGALLFLVVAAVVIALVARRPDRRTMLVGLAVLALAFFILPTRVHERYIFPMVAIGAILAAVSWRWRLAYLVSAVATFANLYAVLTILYPGVRIRDWLGIGPTLVSYWGVAVIAIAHTAVFLWVLSELRPAALRRLGGEIRAESDEAEGLGALEPAWRVAEPRLPVAEPALAAAAPMLSLSEPNMSGAEPAAAADDAWLAAETTAEPDVAVPPPGVMMPPSTGLEWRDVVGRRPVHGARPLLEASPPVVRPVWNERPPAGELGPIEWLRSRLRDRPIRPDRTGALAGEGGGRLDRLDLWLLAVLVVSLLTVRMWRLGEPYQMHFDEVYHPRTATEFLQNWRYGISHDIYEWTHPHLAKYAMAVGIVAWGEDRTAATSKLAMTVTDAAIEPRWDDAMNRYRISGDRLWVASGDGVRAFDLATRAQVGLLPVAGAMSVAVDQAGHRVFVGTADGDIRVVDAGVLDTARAGDPAPVPQALSLLEAGGPVRLLFASTDGSALVAVVSEGEGADGVPAGDGSASADTIVTFDPRSAIELGRVTLRGVGQLTDGGPARIAIANADGVAFLDATTGALGPEVKLPGPAAGVARTFGFGDDDRLYVSYTDAVGDRLVAAVNDISKAEDSPKIGGSFHVPGSTVGPVFFDVATQMLHVLGSVAPPGDGFAARGGAEGDATVYVIEPHGNAVYADAVLPFSPAAIVLDDNQRYPSGDRQQLLALASDGTIATVETGSHAFAWRVPGVLAGVAMGALVYLLTRLLFRRREVALLVGFLTLSDGLLFVQSRIGMNDSYVGLGILAAYTLFAALWLRPGGGRRHWLAFALGMPIIGLSLGLALASKWVAAYAIGGLGILALARSALGRVLLLAGLVLATTVLGYIAISVPEGETGGNYLFLAIMVGLTLAAVIANVVHPVAWSWAEQRLAIGAPIAAGAVIVLAALSTGQASTRLDLGPITATPVDLGFLSFGLAAAVYSVFFLVGRFGYGPMARAPDPGDPVRLLDPPTPAPRGWLNVGSGFGLPALWTLACLVAIPIGVYVLSYLPWAMVEGHQLWPGWPAGNTGRTLLELTGDMYRYHNNLSTPHPASSPWWAWAFDLKPVWFYEESFAGGTAASIYNAGNLVAWWLGIPAMGFIAWQAFARRSAALALVAIAFACQWIAWSRIDRAAFQYHYYTALPFLLIAVAYFLAELWNGASRRTWLLARIAAGIAVLAPFGLWLLHRPLCAFVRVTAVNPGSQACPTLIPDLVVSPRAVAMAVVIAVGVVLLLRILLSIGDDSAGERARAARLRDHLLAAIVTAVGTTIAFVAATTLFADKAAIRLTGVPVEPIALIVTLALLPVAALVATARDARRYVAGAVITIGFWFVLWYPNLAALPLPANIHNAYQGVLPTYLYPFQFPVSTLARAATPPPLLAPGPIALLISLGAVAVAVGYSTWSWRIALAERRRAAARGLSSAEGSRD